MEGAGGKEAHARRNSSGGNGGSDKKTAAPTAHPYPRPALTWDAPLSVLPAVQRAIRLYGTKRRGLRAAREAQGRRSSGVGSRGLLVQRCLKHTPAAAINDQHSTLPAT